MTHPGDAVDLDRTSTTTVATDRSRYTEAERHNLLISRSHGHDAFGRMAGEAIFRSFYLRQACDL